jgi:hypothetical protein
VVSLGGLGREAPLELLIDDEVVSFEELSSPATELLDDVDDEEEGLEEEEVES